MSIHRKDVKFRLNVLGFCAEIPFSGFGNLRNTDKVYRQRRH